MAGGRRFVCLLFLLSSVTLFSLANAHDHEVRGKDGTDHPDAASAGQESFVSGYRLRGRKLAVRIENKMQPKLVNNQNDGVRTRTSSNMVVRTNHQVVKRCEREQEEGGREGGSVECKQRFNGRLSHEEVDGANFVAFNADYNAPRHHPPKNN